MDTRYYLPEELAILILEKLSFSSACRFRSVCKSWRCIISAPGFLQRSILLQSKGRERTLLIAETKRDNPCVFKYPSYTVLESPTSPAPTKFGPLPWSIGWSDAVVVVGSCKGVVCLADLGYRHYALWNPATGEARAIPRHPDNYRHYLGFGHYNGDFKVVTISLDVILKAQIYKLNLDSWRKISPSRIEGKKILLHFGDRTQGCWRDGKMCSWIALHLYPENRPTKYIIVSFDMANETFTSFNSAPVPFRYGDGIGLLTLDDFLAFWYCQSPHRHVREELVLDIWVLLEHGVSESWAKLWTIRVGQELYWPVELWNSGLVMTKDRKDLLLWCDLSNSSCIIQTLPVFAFSNQTWTGNSKVVSFEKTRTSIGTKNPSSNAAKREK